MLYFILGAATATLLYLYLFAEDSKQRRIENLRRISRRYHRGPWA